jgi:CRP-like cAMP-binding protein
MATVSRGGERLATLGPGDYFGELSLLRDTARNATVTADSDLEVLVLDRRHFLGTLAEAPGLARKLLVGMVRRLHEADSRAGLAAAV